MPGKQKEVYAAIMKLVPNLMHLKPGDYQKLTAVGYMDLHLDVLSASNAGNELEIVIALSHYYRNSLGDSIPDPDMEIRISLDRSAADALTYQDLYTYRGVYDETGEVDLEEQDVLNDFLLKWLSNIESQGHSLAEPKEGAK